MSTFTKIGLVLFCLVTWVTLTNKETKPVIVPRSTEEDHLTRYDYHNHEYVTEEEFQKSQAKKQYPEWIRLTKSEREKVRKEVLTDEDIRRIVEDEVQSQMDYGNH